MLWWGIFWVYAQEQFRVILICISLMIKNVEHFFKSFSAIGDSSIGSLIQNSQKLEAAQMSLYQRVNTENVVHLYNGILLSY